MAPNMAGSVPGGSFLKTKVCHHYLQGTCQKGEACSFAHGEHELGMPQGGAADPSMQGFGQAGEMSDEMLLQHLMQDPSGAPGMGGMQSGGAGKGQGKVFKKSKLCTHHSSQGWCSRGEAC